MGDEKLRETEELLKEAADWEPEREAPERLAQLALAAALSQDRDPRPKRPSAGAFFLALVFGGGAATAALSGTLLMVMSRRSEVPVVPLIERDGKLFVDRPFDREAIRKAIRAERDER